MAQPSDVISITLAPDTGDALKVTWSWEGMTFPPYSIDAGLVRRLSAKVRDKLRELVQGAMQTDVSASEPLLAALAESGSELRQALFLSVSGDNAPSEVDRWLTTLPGDHRIRFVVDARVHVPWGLVYDHPTESPAQAISSNASFDSYNGFWCLKYNAATVYVRITPKGLVPGAGRPLEIIPVINRDAFDRAVARLTQEDPALTWLRSRWGTPVHSSSAFFDRWSNVAGRHALIYFYCHANGTKLAIATGDDIPVDTLRLKLQRPDPTKSDCPSVVFLNGCATAIGDPSGGFLEATGSPRFCGFIGTETPIPDVFGLRFGASFLQRFLRTGESISQIMATLRRSHWPLSLVYSINCYPDFRAQAEVRDSASTIPDAVGQAAQGDNYSLGPLGTEEL